MKIGVNLNTQKTRSIGSKNTRLQPAKALDANPLIDLATKTVRNQLNGYLEAYFDAYFDRVATSASI